jgi:clan AA aspartic protease (TIGR02281 family)
MITATLVGPNGQQVSQSLMVDTGASFVVLPQSKGPALGFDLFRLPEQKVQTAKGEHAARVGVLKALTLGDETVSDVQVAFIEDGLVGATALLGMNVLSRFRITIDDERNVLTLEPPPEKPESATEVEQEAETGLQPAQ